MEYDSRYWIGIDLGTTNSVVAYIDRHAHESGSAADIRILEIPQFVAAGEVRSLPALPSFLYFPTDHDRSQGKLTLPWEKEVSAVTGAFAREQGALAPGRQISSAKSWLCHSAVDRRAEILPWGAEPPEPKLSPIEASTRYLAHLRHAWNNNVGSDEESSFEKQQIVLTVPASFDEEARELTVEAARQAGLNNFTLLEEPMAAFYAWIACHPGLLNRNLHGTELRESDLVLVCDVGGGTSDFSLIRARMVGGDVQFERTAIGEHLLLGGDNLDIALTRVVEAKVGAGKLSVRQRHAMQRACCAAKERLLNDATLERVPVSVLGSGRAIVGQMVATELTREDVLDVLSNGFLPLNKPSELPKRDSRAGLRELGLPYASDPAITKHLAAFLKRAATMQESSAPAQSGMVRPDAILFNGGFCAAGVSRERIVDAVSGWFRDGSDWRPIVLDSSGTERAVAVGAAYYALVRQGRGVRIKAGNARSYYVALHSERGIQGVCVLPQGTEEGTTLALADREFSVLANRPVSFTLYSSTVRRDAHGTVVHLEEEQVHRHALLGAMLRYGKRLRELKLAVRLRVTFTEMGTLELWCESLTTEHRWRLQFELRGQEGWVARDAAAGNLSQSSQHESTSKTAEATAAAELIRSAFDSSDKVSPEQLVVKMEEALAMRRDAWPLATIRSLCDVLASAEQGKMKSPQHEVRWLNLFGFCLRPGFGATLDDVRMRMVRKLYMSAPAFPRDIPSQVELLVLLRRVAGGLNASQQQELYKRHAGTLATGGKRRERVNKQVERDTWRLVSSMEHLSAITRAQLGDALIAKIKHDVENTNLFWSLARLGARIPLYGPLGCVVSAETTAKWIEELLGFEKITPECAFAIVQLGAQTGDRARDVDEGLRKKALAKLSAAGIGESRYRLETYVPPAKAEIEQILGESLPKGLRLETSANCLLSVAALTVDIPA